jgi:hypothetical protein
MLDCGMTSTAELARFADGVWLDTTPVRHLGLHLTTTMAVLRLGGGALVLASPVALTPERRAAVEALGPVAHLYAPNLFHHRFIGAWAEAFPAARVHAPQGLRRKRPDLRVDRTHDAGPDPALAGSVEELRVDGCRLEESALFHRPSGTLFVADLVHNLGRSPHGWTRAYSQAMGFCDRVALSRMLRWTAFADRARARRSLDDILALPSERVVVGHGAPLVDGARDALAAAYAWLKP